MESLSLWTALNVLRIMGTSSAKGAVLLGRFDVRVLRAVFQSDMREMPQTILTYHYGIAVKKNNFIFDSTNEAMELLIDTGIPQYFMRYVNEVELKPVLAPEPEPRVFELSDLGFGFYVFLVSCAFSIIAFLGELLWFYGKEMIGLITLLRALKDRNLLPGGTLIDFSPQISTMQDEQKVQKPLIYV